MPATVRYYEVVYVIAPDKTDEQNQAIIDKYTNLIVNQGGTIDRTDVWNAAVSLMRSTATTKASTSLPLSTHSEGRGGTAPCLPD